MCEDIHIDPPNRNLKASRKVTIPTSVNSLLQYTIEYLSKS